MTGTIALPVWLAALAGVLALWAILYLLLIPGGRWFVRWRVNRLIDELNTRLQLRIPAFQQTRRQVLVDRLTYGPRGIGGGRDGGAGVRRAARSPDPQGRAPRTRDSCRRSTPGRTSESATSLARRTAQLLYRVRLGYSDDEALSRIEPDTSVVFVMNHRSNMDYVLVAYLAASRSALSYAVGEWARIWPLQTLFRSLGAYFVRRKSDESALSPGARRIRSGGDGRRRGPGDLPRREPESRRQAAPAPARPDQLHALGIRPGRRTRPRLHSGGNQLRPRTGGFASWCTSSTRSPIRTPRTHVVATLLRFAVDQAVLMLRRRWYRFGYACVNFGSPVSMRAYARRHGIDFRAMDPTARFDAVERLGGELLDAVASAIPVVPVPLVATVFARHPGARHERTGDQGAGPRSRRGSSSGTARTSTSRAETVTTRSRLDCGC